LVIHVKRGIQYLFSTSPPVSPSPIKERGRYLVRGAVPLLDTPFYNQLFVFYLTPCIPLSYQGEGKVYAGGVSPLQASL
jgi:hypothetical protein